jgi:hypothetical protein
MGTRRRLRSVGVGFRLVSRTLTEPPTSRVMWRRLLRRVHPDGGGDHDLFIWSKSLYEHVSGNQLEPPQQHTRRDPPQHKRTGERVDYSGAERFGSFEDLARHAVAMAAEEPPVYGDLLYLLADCYPSVPTDHVLRRSEWQGATYKQLAFIGHLAGMGSAERSAWYAVAEAIPLSQRHAGHIISRLKAEDAA